MENSNAMEVNKATEAATQVNKATEAATQVNTATEAATQVNTATESNPTPCHICERMRTRKPGRPASLFSHVPVEGKHANLKTEGPVQVCVLCARKFCEIHKGKDAGVCEINHQTYWDNHKRRVPEGTIFSSLWHLEGYKRIKQLEADGEL